MKKFDRRSFLKTSSLSAAAIASTSLLASCTPPKRTSKGTYMGGFAAPKIPNLRAAFIGVGARGGDHLRVVASMENTEVVAISDLYEDHVERWSQIASDIGKGERHQNVASYFGGEDLWKKMLEEVKPDVVFIATNWENHANMVIQAMKSGAHAFVEVPIATTLEAMWEIIHTSEETQKHCMMMENVNYGRT
ncbi:MAG: Gfo/Idh/MocA family oxidoreductase, partial [Flavobacteriaceae bacterium]|nr:Gfo/Idh/MocA family oxidoreductase [Candidatus Arcticimaribacter sp.]